MGMPDANVHKRNSGTFYVGVLGLYFLLLVGHGIQGTEAFTRNCCQSKKVAFRNQIKQLTTSLLTQERVYEIR